MPLLEDANATKVSKNDVEKYADALKSFPHFMVLSEKFEGDDIVKCFRIEVGQDSPRPQVLQLCSARYNKFSREAVQEYIKENTKPGKAGRKPKNGSTEE